MLDNQTIAAIATPPGQGAIGVIRLSGDKAIAICDEVFHGSALKEQASHTIHFGTIRDGGTILDEVLVSLFVAPKSYTGENVVEISCHGSAYILDQVLQLFVRTGARLAKPGEFTLRAFLNGKMDLSQAEAVADLIASSSSSSHDLAMKQMRGGFSTEIQKLREELINFASLIELELDFSEEDVEFADRTQLVELIDKIRTLLRGLIESFRLGNVLKNGVNTVIAGRPNAGKSTLLNALLNEERAIVSDIPGTTRDTIEEVLNIDGIAFRFIDTAGIRDASDKIEAIGVEKTMEKIQSATLVVYLFDAAETTPEMLVEDLAKLGSEDIPVLAVANKSDLTTSPAVDSPDVLAVSAKTGTGLDTLRSALFDTVVKDGVNRESTIVSNVRHYEALENADKALQDVLAGMDNQISGDLLALDIKKALFHLGEITGEITNDDLLGNIFGKFCIGK